jgi:hypothetical protein
MLRGAVAVVLAKFSPLDVQSRLRRRAVELWGATQLVGKMKNDE